MLQYDVDAGESEFQRKAHEQGARTMKLIVEIIKDMPTAAIDALKFFVEGMVKFVTTPIGQRVE
jgi:hypothetical protein